MGRFDGKVVFVTGAARGQGRSHAVRFAAEGADIIGIDMCHGLDTVQYGLGQESDLAETVHQVEALDRRMIASVADVRDFTALEDAAAAGAREFGRLDVILPNAGIVASGPTWEMPIDKWHDVVDINLTGVFHTIRAAVPHMVQAGNGGNIIFTGSLAAMRGIANAGAYVAAKHGVMGLMRTLANELAAHDIRVNAVNPTNVATDMLHNATNYKLFVPEEADPSLADALDRFMSLNLMPVPWIEPQDISNAMMWLCSDEARFVTGSMLPVDAGGFVKTIR
jgi:SDR family mycofactocin-dependent oxidoreductase